LISDSATASRIDLASIYIVSDPVVFTPAGGDMPPKAFCFPPVQLCVRVSHIIRYKSENTISYELLVEIPPKLQRICSWGV